MLHHQLLFGGFFIQSGSTNFQLLNIKIEEKNAENVEKLSFQLFKHGDFFRFSPLLLQLFVHVEAIIFTRTRGSFLRERAQDMTFNLLRVGGSFKVSTTLNCSLGKLSID